MISTLDILFAPLYPLVFQEISAVSNKYRFTVHQRLVSLGNLFPFSYPIPQRLSFLTSFLEAPSQKLSFTGRSNHTHVSLSCGLFNPFSLFWPRAQNTLLTTITFSLDFFSSPKCIQSYFLLHFSCTMNSRTPPRLVLSGEMLYTPQGSFLLGPDSLQFPCRPFTLILLSPFTKLFAISTSRVWPIPCWPTPFPSPPSPFVP